MPRISIFEQIHERHRDTFIRQNVKKKCAKKPRQGRVDLDNAQESRNATISRLPVETMAEIFKFAQLRQNSRLNGDDGKRRHSRWCWLTFTHVCKGWRDIAVGTKELWAHIDIGEHVSSEQTCVYLERSGSFPLHVYCHDEGVNICARESLRLTLQHIHRIRRLHIEELWDEEDLKEIIINPAPMLVEFSIGKDPHPSLDIIPFFACQAPNLTSLSIDLFLEIPLWGHIPIMQNLTHLAINVGIDLGDLISIISQNLNYEMFSFFVLEASEGQSQAHSSIIIMPSLKSLEIQEAGCTALCQLFNRVKFPAMNEWNIVCDEFPFKMVDADVVHPKSVIPRASDMGPLSLTLFISSEFVKITAEPLNDADGLHFKRTIEFSRIIQTISDGFELIRSAIEGDFWCDATELTVEVASESMEEKDLWSLGVRSEDWKSLLEILPQVQRLSMKHLWSKPYCARTIARTETHYGLLGALGKLPGKNGSHMICPDLSELYLCGFSLYNANGGDFALELLKNWGRQLSLLRVTNLVNSESTRAKMHLLEASGVARNIEVDMR